MAPRLECSCLFIEEEELGGSQEAWANLSGILVAVGVAISAKENLVAGWTDSEVVGVDMVDWCSESGVGGSVSSYLLFLRGEVTKLVWTANWFGYLFLI